MRHDGSMSLFRYWNRLRNGRAAPKRTEIEPAEIKNLLADTFILECDTRGQPVFRLAGTRLCAIFGRELKGFAFASLWSEKERRVVTRLVNSCLHDKAVVVMTIGGATRTGRENSFELIVLPLDGGPNHARALGSMIALERPFWLGADPVVTCWVDAIRIVDPSREAASARLPAVLVPSLEPTDRETMAAMPMRRIRHLVVIDGGKGE